jgi:hypothetical protein
LDDTVSHLESEHRHEVFRINSDIKDPKTSLANITTSISASKKSLLLLGAPVNLKECYVLKEKKIIPTKVLYLKEDLQGMSNYYFGKDGELTEEQALQLAKQELTHLEEVK